MGNTIRFVLSLPNHSRYFTAQTFDMPWWGKSADSKESKPEQPATPSQPQPASSFDPDKLPDARKLPKAMQSIVDNSDKDSSFFDDVAEGFGPDSTESNVRYAAYATRIRTIMLSAHRYVAYTSDIGESFRPVAHPNIVRAAYGISWLYILGDVSHEGCRAWKRTLRSCQEPCHLWRITGRSWCSAVCSRAWRPWSASLYYPQRRAILGQGTEGCQKQDSANMGSYW